LEDPNDPSVDLGTVPEGHRWSQGVAWRADME
jgi:hypothetical protein